MLPDFGDIEPERVIACDEWFAVVRDNIPYHRGTR
jgi:hypothetical protein